MFNVEVTFQPVEADTIKWTCEVEAINELFINFNAFHRYNSLSPLMVIILAPAHNITLFRSTVKGSMEVIKKEAEEFVAKLTTYINVCREANKKGFSVQI